jgi:hypothetical protein
MGKYVGFTGEHVDALRLETEDTRPEWGEFVDELHAFLKGRVHEWEGDESGLVLYESDENYIRVNELEWIVAYQNTDGTDGIAVMTEEEFRAAYEDVES